MRDAGLRRLLILRRHPRRQSPAESANGHLKQRAAEGGGEEARLGERLIRDIEREFQEIMENLKTGPAAKRGECRSTRPWHRQIRRPSRCQSCRRPNSKSQTSRPRSRTRRQPNSVAGGGERENTRGSGCEHPSPEAQASSEGQDQQTSEGRFATELVSDLVPTSRASNATLLFLIVTATGAPYIPTGQAQA